MCLASKFQVTTGAEFQLIDFLAARRGLRRRIGCRGDILSPPFAASAYDLGFSGIC